MKVDYLQATPNPEHLIKSIAEQGYTLETALADLIDNSISANTDNVEVLTSQTNSKLKVFIVDDGDGMNEHELSQNMMFPSRNVENRRDISDLGRFGLGLKTASFSQTRKFTVLSRKKGTESFHARTWDVNYLKECGEWRMIKNDSNEIECILHEYKIVSENHLSAFDNYRPNTIIVWDGLYKFENYTNPDNQIKHFKEQINTVTSEYLGIVFHRFIDDISHPLHIRINNIRVSSFDPFISKNNILARSLGEREMKFGEDVLRMNAYVLPVSASDEEQQWTTEHKNLMDLEGVYIYRGNRIIFFGGWNGIIRKQTKLKLARLKIEFDNVNDDKLQLNVAKSKIEIPYELKQGVLRYIIELRDQAKKEYSNRGLKETQESSYKNNLDLLKRVQTSKGIIYELNNSYPLLEDINSGLTISQQKKMQIFLRVINFKINKQRHAESNFVEYISDKDSIINDELFNSIKMLINSGFDKKLIYNNVLKDLGLSKENIPEKIKEILT